MHHSKTLDEVEIVRRLCDGAVSRLLVDNLARRPTEQTHPSAHHPHQQMTPRLPHYHIGRRQSHNQNSQQLQHQLQQALALQQLQCANPLLASVLLGIVSSSSSLPSNHHAFLAPVATVRVEKQTQTSWKKEKEEEIKEEESKRCMQAKKKIWRSACCTDIY